MKVRTLMVPTVALALTASLLGVPAVSATPAEAARADTEPGITSGSTAKKKLKVTWSKLRRTSQTKPYPLKVSYRLPVLRGATKKNSVALRKMAKRTIDEQLDSFTEWRRDCWADGETGTADFTGTASTYAGRYVSIALTEKFNIGCSGQIYQGSTVRTFTIDLRTGKQVSLARFAQRKHVSTRLAVISALKRAHGECISEEILAWESYPSMDNWTLNRKGVRFWFAGSAVGPKWCGVQSATVPWRELATKKQRKGKKTSQVFVRDFAKVPGEDYYMGLFKVLTVRGRDVGTYKSAVYSGEAWCERGTRRGKKAIVYDFGTWDMGASRYTDHARRVRYTLGGTKSVPRLPSSEGWRLATKAERAFIVESHGGKFGDAYQMCWG